MKIRLAKKIMKDPSFRYSAGKIVNAMIRVGMHFPSRKIAMTRGDWLELNKAVMLSAQLRLYQVRLGEIKV